MKFIVLLLFFILFLSSLNLKASTMNIILDAGHGGPDSGAVFKDIKESDFTLKITNRVYDFLKNNPSFETHRTRANDRPISLNKRTELATKYRGNLFLSIHVNSSTDTSVSGTEIYFQSQMSSDEESYFLANRENEESHLEEDSYNEENRDEDQRPSLAIILEDLKKTNSIYASNDFSEILKKSWNHQYTKRRVSIRQGPFRVLMENPMPAILIEVGFITNENDRKLLKNENEVTKIAQIIYKSICQYKEKIDKTGFSSNIAL